MEIYRYIASRARTVMAIKTIDDKENRLKRITTLLTVFCTSECSTRRPT